MDNQNREDKDIKSLKRILNYQGRKDLVMLLNGATSYLETTNSFGTMLYSVISYFHIKYHPKFIENFKELSEEDKQIIYDSVLQIYPDKSHEPEIRNVYYNPNHEIENYEFIETESIDKLSFDYLQEQIEKCKAKIETNDYEGAITNARNLLESTCLNILEEKEGNPVENDGNLIKLYRKAAIKLNMLPENHNDESLKQILSGSISIVNGISNLRNNYSDSHGAGPSKKKYRIEKRHALLAVNLSFTISEFLVESYNK